MPVGPPRVASFECRFLPLGDPSFGPGASGDRYQIHTSAPNGRGRGHHRVYDEHDLVLDLTFFLGRFDAATTTRQGAEWDA